MNYLCHLNGLLMRYISIPYFSNTFEYCSRIFLCHFNIPLGDYLRNGLFATFEKSITHLPSEISTGISSSKEYLFGM